MITRRNSKWLCLAAGKNISLHFEHKHKPIFKCLLTVMHTLSEVLTESSHNERHVLTCFKIWRFFLTDKSLKHHFLIRSFFSHFALYSGFIKILIFISYLSTWNLLGTLLGVLFSARKIKSFQGVSRASTWLTGNLQGQTVSLSRVPSGREMLFWEGDSPMHPSLMTAEILN